MAGYYRLYINYIWTLTIFLAITFNIERNYYFLGVIMVFWRFLKHLYLLGIQYEILINDIKTCQNFLQNNMK